MIKVLHKAFDLLECMSADKNRIFTLRELSELIKDKPSTCANIVKTLCERGYLSRVEPKGYRLGPVAQGLNYTDQKDARLVECAQEPMRALTHRFGASGVLAVLRRGRKKILDDYKSVGDFTVSKAVRGDRELYTTSTGLVLTCERSADFSEEEERLICETYGSAERFLELRREIRESGYISIVIRPRILEIAAPIRKEGEVFASVAVYLPEFLLEEEQKESLVQSLCELARQIEERMENT